VSSFEGRSNTIVAVPRKYKNGLKSKILITTKTQSNEQTESKNIKNIYNKSSFLNRNFRKCLKSYICICIKNEKLSYFQKSGVTNFIYYKALKMPSNDCRSKCLK
jgi:hypothetical protein